MSWSTGSSAPGFRRANGRRDGGGDSRSPVPYREGAMSYEPAKFCRCNPPRKAPRWISWSKMNPGRRYYACVDAMHGGCGYVEWHDRELPKFFSDLIGDLRDEVWRLRGEGSEAPIEDAGNVAMQEVPIAGTMALQTLQDQLKLQNAEIDALKGRNKHVLFLFAIFVLGLVLGKILLH